MTSDAAAWHHKDGFDVFEYSNETLIKLEDHERIVNELKLSVAESVADLKTTRATIRVMTENRKNLEKENTRLQGLLITETRW